MGVFGNPINQLGKDATMTTTADQAVELDGFRFAMIPEAMIYSDLSGTAIKVFGALLRHGVDPAHCYPSHKRLANLCRLSVPTVKRAIADLEDSGWVTVIHRKSTAGGQASNGYRLHQQGKETLTPQVTSDLPPQVIDELPPRSPVSYEREQLNESNLNENPSTPKARQERAPETPTEGGKETYGFNQLAERDADAIAAALNAGWTHKQIADTAEQCRTNPELRSPRAVWRHRLTNEDPPATAVADVTTTIIAWTARGKPQGQLAGQAAELYAANKAIRDACRNGTESDIRSAIRQAVAA